MCGISGYFSRSPLPQKKIDCLREGIRRRGTDNFGETENFVPAIAFSALYHARLSIIDLTSASNQPFSKKGSRNKLVYNGEVYNYRELRRELSANFGVKFETDGDTEVIYEGLRCLGKNFIEMISGEFAFCFLDLDAERVLLSRDSFGKKPLSYVAEDDAFLFSSNEKSLGKLEFGIDQFNAFCTLGYIPERMPLFSGVNILDPGGIIEVDLKTLKPRIIKDKSTKPTETDIRQSVRGSIYRQMTADVPVGVFLSGGFDSTLVAAVASEKSHPLHAFSFISDDVNSEEQIIDDWLSARGNNFKVDKVHSSDINLPNELELVLPNLYRPTADSSIVPTNVLSRTAFNNGVKVVLSGLGGDEIFCGYNRYYNRRLISKFNFSSLRSLAIVTQNFRTYRLSSRDVDLAISAFIDTSYFKNMSDKNKIKICERLDAFIRKPGSIGGLRYLMQSDLNNYTVDLLHRQYDVISLMNNVEMRSPLLDSAVHQSLNNLSDQHFIKGGRMKSIQAEMFRNCFTSAQLAAKKQGFSGPIKQWVEKYKDFFDFHSSQGYVNYHFGASPTNANDKWVYTCLNIWLSQF